MVNIKLGDKTYENVEAVKLDTPEGGTVEFAPYEETFAAGKAEGIAEGKKSEYDRFWDTCQDYGNRTEYGRSYGCSFAGYCWGSGNFFPKYDIKPIGADYIFYAWQDSKKHTVNLAQRLRDCGVVLDTSKATSLAYAFAWSKYLTNIPAIDATSVDPKEGLRNTFKSFNAAETTIEKLIVKEELCFPDTFNDSTHLIGISFEGVIGNSISFGACRSLNAASVQSVLDHLKDLTGQTAQTLTFHADVGAKLTEAQKAAITAKNWTLVY